MECRWPLGPKAVYRERPIGGSVRQVRNSFEAILRSRDTASAQLNGDKSQVSGRIAIPRMSVVSWSDRLATGSEPRHVSGRGTRPSPRDRILAHPTRFERVAFAVGALLPPAPSPARPLPSLAQYDELTHLRRAENVSSAFASMQSNDAVDGVQFGWLD
jgi:hypothetical protein